MDFGSALYNTLQEGKVPEVMEGTYTGHLLGGALQAQRPFFQAINGDNDTRSMLRMLDYYLLAKADQARAASHVRKAIDIIPVNSSEDPRAIRLRVLYSTL